MKGETLRLVNKFKKNRQPFVIIKNMSTEKSDVLRPSEAIPDFLKTAFLQAIQTGKSQLVSVEDGEYFLDTYIPPARLVVVGAVHITQHLALIARTCGYQLEVIDPRTAFATPERFEGVKLTADWPETVLNDDPLDAYSALIALTHDPKIDDFALIHGLNKNCFYVGALGSRKTHAKRITRLEEAGVKPSLLENIHAPIGLDIRAANPAEIAVAIMAQVIDSFRRRGTS